VKLTVPLRFNEHDVKSNKNYMSCSTDLDEVKLLGKVNLTPLGIFGERITQNRCVKEESSN
jgi:hypothetical protein